VRPYRGTIEAITELINGRVMPANPRSFLAGSDGVNRLNDAKTRLKLTNVALADQAGVSADTVGRLLHPERGDRAPLLRFISRTCLVKVADMDSNP